MGAIVRVYIGVGFNLIVIKDNCILLTALDSRRLIQVLIPSLGIHLSRGLALLGPYVFPFVLRAEEVIVVAAVATAAAIATTIADFVVDSAV